MEGFSGSIWDPSSQRSKQYTGTLHALLRRCSSLLSARLCVTIPLCPVWRKNNRGSPTVSGLTPQSVSRSPLSPSWFLLLFPLSSQNSSQISIDSAGRSSSPPRRSELRWGRSRSSRPPSPPGWWYHQTAPGRRCLWSAQWRRAPRWWRHEPTSPRSASRTPRPASLLLGGWPKDQMRGEVWQWLTDLWRCHFHDNGI